MLHKSKVMLKTDFVDIFFIKLFFFSNKVEIKKPYMFSFRFKTCDTEKSLI